MNVLALVQARMGSTRLPGKVLQDVAGATLLERVVARVERIEGVEGIEIATSTDAGDDAVAELSAQRGWECFRGSETDVLDRFRQAAATAAAAHVLRVTADCPLLSWEEADRVIAHHVLTGADYTHNVTVWGSGMPLGTGTEIFTFDALDQSWRDGHQPHHREHVDEFVYEHPERFRIERVEAPEHLRRPDLRLTVDTADDLELIREIQRRLGSQRAVPLAEVVELLDAEPDLARRNEHVQQKRT